MPPETLLRALVPPLLIAAAALLSGWRPWRGSRGGGAGWASAAAVGFGFALGESLIRGRWPGLPPVEPRRWLPYAAIAIALAAAVFNFPRRTQRAAALLLAAACLLPVLWSDLTSRLTVAGGIVTLALISMAAATVRNGTLLAPCGVRVPLVFFVTSIGGSIALMQSFNAADSLIAAALAVIMSVFLALSIWRPWLEVHPGGGLAFAVVFLGLILTAQVPAASRAFLLLALLAPYLALIPGSNRAPPWALTLACVVFAGVMCAASIALTPMAFDFSE